MTEGQRGGFKLTSGYRDTFVSSTGTEAGSSIGELLNAFNRVYEANIRKGKLGLPNGIITFSQTPQPGLVEAPFAAEWVWTSWQKA